MPTRVLDLLRFTDSFAQAERVVRTRELLEAEGAALSDDLHAVIGALAAGHEKASLVGLRRAVFRLRPPAPREWNEKVAALLPDDIKNRVTAWRAALAAHERAKSGLPALMASEFKEKSAALRGVVAVPEFQRALFHASPVLFAETRKWLEDGDSRPRQHSLVRLAAYTVRAATKTSPFSTFTVVGPGVWSGPAPSARFTAPPRIEGVPELNGILVHGVKNALAQDPRWAARVAYRLNPSATVVGDTVRFLGRLPEESLAAIPATAAVRRCLHVLGDGLGRTAAELGVLLGDPGGGRSADFLAHLADAGLLQRHVPVPDLADDPLGLIADWMDTQGDTEAAGVASAARRVRSVLRAPSPVADVDGHTRRHRALDREIEELLTRVGLPPDTVTDQGKRTVYDNGVLTGTAVALPAASWRGALQDLDAVRRVLAPFDPVLPLRLTLAAYCAERFGAGCRVPFLALHEAIAHDLTAGAAPDLAAAVRLRPEETFGESRSPHVRDLAGMRAAVRGALLPPAGADGVVRAAPDALLRLAASWPAWIAAPPSVTWYLQAVEGRQAARLVVNKVHGGHGRNRSRALHLVRRADPAAPLDRTWGATAPGAVTAELGGAFGFSPNVRHPSAPYEIDYPFTVSGRPAAQRLPVRDLEVVHRPGTDTVVLVSRALGSRVTPLHLGMMADALLPPAARLMVQAFGGACLAGPTLRVLTAARTSPEPRGVQVCPRVEVGDVVVRRARWLVAADQVPVRGAGRSDADHLVRLLAWLRASGLPTRSFVRVQDPDPDGAPRSITQIMSDHSRKPVYLDAANLYLVLAFERMLKGGGSAVVFEEALPAPEDARGPDPDAPATTEFIVEMSDPTAHDG